MAISIAHTAVTMFATVFKLIRSIYLLPPPRDVSMAKTMASIIATKIKTIVTNIKGQSILYLRIILLSPPIKSKGQGAPVCGYPPSNTSIRCHLLRYDGNHVCSRTQTQEIALSNRAYFCSRLKTRMRFFVYLNNQ